MNTKSFLLGYFYSAFTLFNSYGNSEENSWDAISTDRRIDVIRLETTVGKLGIILNGGQAITSGNSAYCAKHYDTSNFRILSNLCDSLVWDIVKSNKFWKEQLEIDRNEVNISFQELIRLIDHSLDGIDYHLTIKNCK